MSLKVAYTNPKKVAYRLPLTTIALVVVIKNYYYKSLFSKGLSKISILARLYLTYRTYAKATLRVARSLSRW
jgi:hypothetical protein